MRKLKTIVSVSFLCVISFVGCSSISGVMGDLAKTYDYNENSIDYWSINASVTKETMLNSSTVFLVDQGFDIKFSNEGAGLITTEFKKGSEIESDGVTFDIYLQIKTTIHSTDGNILVKLTPLMKIQNRLNASAYTESKLKYLSGDEAALDAIGMHSAYDETFKKFSTYATSIAELAGVTVNEYSRIESSIPKTYNPLASIAEAM